MSRCTVHGVISDRQSGAALGDLDVDVELVDWPRVGQWQILGTGRADARGVYSVAVTFPDLQDLHALPGHPAVFARVRRDALHFGLSRGVWLSQCHDEPKLALSVATNLQTAAIATWQLSANRGRAETDPPMPPRSEERASRSDARPKQPNRPKIPPRARAPSPSGVPKQRAAFETRFAAEVAAVGIGVSDYCVCVPRKVLEHFFNAQIASDIPIFSKYLTDAAKVAWPIVTPGSYLLRATPFFSKPMPWVFDGIIFNVDAKTAAVGFTGNATITYRIPTPTLPHLLTGKVKISANIASSLIPTIAKSALPSAISEAKFSAEFMPARYHVDWFGSFASEGFTSADMLEPSPTVPSPDAFFRFLQMCDRLGKPSVSAALKGLVSETANPMDFLTVDWFRTVSALILLEEEKSKNAKEKFVDPLRDVLGKVWSSFTPWKVPAPNNPAKTVFSDLTATDSVRCFGRSLNLKEFVEGLGDGEFKPPQMQGVADNIQIAVQLGQLGRIAGAAATTNLSPNPLKDLDFSWWDFPLGLDVDVDDQGVLAIRFHESGNANSGASVFSTSKCEFSSVSVFLTVNKKNELAVHATFAFQFHDWKRKDGDSTLFNGKTVDFGRVAFFFDSSKEFPKDDASAVLGGGVKAFGMMVANELMGAFLSFGKNFAAQLVQLADLSNYFAPIGKSISAKVNAETKKHLLEIRFASDAILLTMQPPWGKGTAEAQTAAESDWQYVISEYIVQPAPLLSFIPEIDAQGQPTGGVISASIPIGGTKMAGIAIANAAIPQGGTGVALNHQTVNQRAFFPVIAAAGTKNFWDSLAAFPFPFREFTKFESILFEPEHMLGAASKPFAVAAKLTDSVLVSASKMAIADGAESAAIQITLDVNHEISATQQKLIAQFSQSGAKLAEALNKIAHASGHQAAIDLVLASTPDPTWLETWVSELFSIAVPKEYAEIVGEARLVLLKLLAEMPEQILLADAHLDDQILPFGAVKK